MLTHWIRQFLKAVLRPHVSPHQVALGAAIGVVVAFTPTVGFQMIIAVALATAVRASRPAAAVPVWITNPLTILPIYGFTYWVGWLLVGGPTVGAFTSRLGAVVQRLESHSAWEFLDRFGVLLTLGGEVMVALTVGGLIVGGACGIVSYGLVRGLLYCFPRPHQDGSAKAVVTVATEPSRRAA